MSLYDPALSQLAHCVSHVETRFAEQVGMSRKASIIKELLA